MAISHHTQSSGVLFKKKSVLVHAKNSVSYLVWKKEEKATILPLVIPMYRTNMTSYKKAKIRVTYIRDTPNEHVTLLVSMCMMQG